MKIITLILWGILYGMLQNASAVNFQWQANKKDGFICEFSDNNTVKIFTTTNGALWSKRFLLSPEKQYEFSFSCSAENTRRSIVAKTNYIRKVLNQLSTEPTDYSFVFSPIKEEIKKGVALVVHSTHLGGNFALKNMALREYLPLYLSTELGEFETIKDGKYIFNTQFSSKGFCFKPMPKIEGFPSFSIGWDLNKTSSVSYKFGVAGLKQFDGDVSVSVSYNPKGKKLFVWASNDGENFKQIAELSARKETAIKLPPTLFPAEFITIKITTDNTPSGISFDALKYIATIDNQKLKFHNTLYGAGRADISENVVVDRKYWEATSKKVALKVKSSTNQSVKIFVQCEHLNGKKQTFTLSEKLKVGENSINVKLPFRLKEMFNFTVFVKELDWKMSYDVSRAKLSLIESDYNGRLLPCDIKNLTIWQSSLTNKLSRECATPTKTQSVIEIFSAKNEAETIQLAFKAKSKQTILVEPSSLVHSDGVSKIDTTNIKTFLVDYVKISNQTDSMSSFDFWPDPTPEIKGEKVEVAKNVVQPILIRYSIADNTKAGLYKGVIKIKSDSKIVNLPISLKVFDFSLPEKPALRSGFGDGYHYMAAYYKDPKNARAIVRNQIFEKLSVARCSPYNSLSPKYKLVYPGNDKTKQPKVVFDWVGFDNIVKNITNKHNFNAQVLRLDGIGGGIHNNHVEGRTRGIESTNPHFEKVLIDYLTQINTHIVENGWQDLFYTYTFDEPEPTDYEFIKREISKIRKYLPSIKVMLTDTPVAELSDYVDIWCPVSRNFDITKPALCKNKEVWWYICMQPIQPYAGMFVDHAGIDLRVWLWQTYKYGIDGILIWQISYLTSPTAYPNSLQNVYDDPMSWMQGYGVPIGEKRRWGNGDGRLFYPPISTKNGSLAEVGEDFVETLRLEILREGIEDYEYLKLLESLIKIKKDKLDTKTLSAFEALLIVPDSITKSRTEFSYTDTAIQKRRKQIAAAIEKLIQK